MVTRHRKAMRVDLELDDLELDDLELDDLDLDIAVIDVGLPAASLKNPLPAGRQTPILLDLAALVRLVDRP